MTTFTGDKRAGSTFDRLHEAETKAVQAFGPAKITATVTISGFIAASGVLAKSLFDGKNLSAYQQVGRASGYIGTLVISTVYGLSQKDLGKLVKAELQGASSVAGAIIGFELGGPVVSFVMGNLAGAAAGAIFDEISSNAANYSFPSSSFQYGVGNYGTPDALSSLLSSRSGSGSQSGAGNSWHFDPLSGTGDFNPYSITDPAYGPITSGYTGQNMGLDTPSEMGAAPAATLATPVAIAHMIPATAIGSLSVPIVQPISLTPVMPVMPTYPATAFDFSYMPGSNYNGSSLNSKGDGAGGGLGYSGYHGSTDSDASTDTGSTDNGSQSGSGANGSSGGQKSASTGTSHHSGSSGAKGGVVGGIGANGASPFGGGGSGSVTVTGSWDYTDQDGNVVGHGYSYTDANGKAADHVDLNNGNSFDAEENDHGQVGAPSGSLNGSGSDDDSPPVLLDLTGNGININPISTSTYFVEEQGDGYQHRTAWAGDGTGVLVIDADGNGKITNASEYEFTQWDPSATSDLQAIRDVFDTNGNGKLDAGDGAWSQFKVSVNGQLVTLGSLGITSIDLTPKGSGQTFSDGSAITGTTTYTKADGSTGAVGDAIFTTDANGYIISCQSVTNADSTTTETLLGYNSDGSLAFKNLINTSADGKTITTNFDDDGNGTFDRSQTNVISVDANGIRTQTVSDFNADSSLVSKTTTVTSADHQTITTTIDQDGNGTNDQSQVFTTAADGSSTTTTKGLSFSGTLLQQVVVQSDATGLSKTTRTDINGDGVDDDVLSDVITIAADGSKTRTVQDRSNNATLLSSTITTTSADSRTKSITSDIDANGSIDSRVQVVTSVGTAGAITVDVTTNNGDNSLRGRTTTVTTADGLSKTVSTDIDGDTHYDVVSSDVTVVAADLSRVETVQSKSGNGALLSKVVTTIDVNGKTTSISKDTNGDGALDSLETISVDGSGVTTDTVAATSADGSVISRVTSVAAANGLSRTTSSDLNGDGTSDRISSDVIVTNTDSSRTETVTAKSASGAILSQSVTTTSADSLTQAQKLDINGDGVFDQTSSDTIVLNSVGGRTETVNVKSADGTLASSVITTVSPDRRTTTVTTDSNGDGHADTNLLQTTAGDATQTTTTSQTSASGVLLKKTSTVVSGDGLTKTVNTDLDGDGNLDLTFVDQTVLRVDGSRVETQTNKSANSTLLNKSTTTVTGNGTTITIETDSNGDGIVDAKTVKTVAYSNAGSTITAVSDYAGTSLTDKATTTLSANGLSTRVDVDQDGNGTIDRSTADTKTLNTDGSTGEIVSISSNSGALISKTTKSTSADAKTFVTSWDINGDTVIDVKETVALNAAGLTTDTVEQYKAAGALGSRSVVATTSNGLSRTSSSDLDGDGVFELVTTDVTTLNTDGSQTRIISKFGANSVLTSRTTTTVSANGLSKTVSWADGSGTTVRSESDVSVVNADGTTTETLSVFKAGGTLESKAVSSATPHNLVATVTSDINGDGVVDQRSVTTRNADGSVGQVLADLSATGATLDSKSTTVSGNGLVQTVDFDTDGNGVVDRRTTTTTVLNANGSTTSTTTLLIAVAGTLTAKGSTVVDTSGDGLTVSTKWDTTGSGTFDKTQTDVTTLNADGSKTRTVSNFSGGTLSSRYLTTTSANGLSITSQSDITGAGTYGQSSTDVKVLNADGSVTRTISATKADGTVISSSVIRTSPNGQVISSNDQRTGFATEILSDTTEVLADGAVRETATTTDGAGKLLDKMVRLTSADRLTVTVDRDANGDGIVDQHQQSVVANSGIVTSVMTDLKSSGTVLDRSTTTVSANGLQTTIDWDLDGNGTTDRRRVEADSNNADGSRTSVISDTDLTTNKLASKITTTRSADGTRRTTSKDVNGDGVIDQSDTLTTDSRGASVDIVTNTATAQSASYLTAGGVYWKQAIAAKIETDSSPDGRSKTIKFDYNGDGIFETIMQSQLQIDGLVATTVAETTAAGATVAKGTITTSADGQTTILNKDTNNDGIIDHIETSVTHADGSVTLTKVDRNADSSLKQTVVDSVSALGSLVMRVTSDSLSHKTSQVLIASDGSSIVTTYDGPSGQQLSVSNVNKAGLLTSGVLYDPLNAQAWTRVEQSFDASGKKTLEKQFNDNGTRTEISFYTPTGAQQHIDYFNTSGVRTSSIDYDLLNTASWARVEISYDAAARVTYRAEFNDDGTKTAYTYDAANAQSYSSITQSFNAAGQLIVQTQYNDNSTKNIALFDPANTQDWSRIDQTFDTSGRMTYQLNAEDDGTKAAYTFDAASNQSWSRIDQNFDTAGRLAYQAQNNDDGTRNVTTFDPANVQGWSRVDQNFDTSGRLTYQINTNDDGTKYAYTYDPANTQPWSRIDQNFDTSGRLTYQSQNNDDGSRSAVTYDPANSQPWSRIEQSFDTAGRLPTQSVFNDDGTRNAYIYDVTNAQPWSTITQVFDTSGRMTSQTQNNDDGGRVQYQYDVNNAQPWSSVADVYTSGGQLATDYVYSDDASKWTATSYDVNNNQGWTSLVQNFINSGHITTARSNNDDGTYTNYQYNSSGAVTAWQRYQYQSGPHSGNTWVMIDQYPVPRSGHGPVLLDLDGDGHIDLRPLDLSALATGSSTTFDWNSDGAKDGTAWVGPNDGFLAIDLGADGQSGPDGSIDQAKELAFSLWASDADVAANGGSVSDLDGLRLAFDSNHDNILDANDARWSEFRVWRDSNQNGVSDPGELLTMSDAGIKLINLLPSSDGAQAFSDGSSISGTSSYEMTNGAKYLVGDATLMSQPAVPVPAAA
ncbi:beta strand repeat-containing protein [Rhizobium sp. HT1-10]|uniref:beta strand repeat-containing protein n=1 Tax=Rhizobium sp. HT1-10 TaxID=3111638 RepID=UPI003C200B91